MASTSGFPALLPRPARFQASTSRSGSAYASTWTGALWSTSNLDLLAGRRLDLVICLNPMSAEWPTHHWPAGTMVARAQSAEHQRVLHEASLLEQTGTPVVLIEPTAADLSLMGSNLMRRRHSEEVIELAKEAGKRGGIYDTHQRDESTYSIGLIASSKEVLQIGPRGASSSALHAYQGAGQGSVGEIGRGHQADRGRKGRRPERHRQSISLAGLVHRTGCGAGGRR